MGNSGMAVQINQSGWDNMKIDSQHAVRKVLDLV